MVNFLYDPEYWRSRGSEIRSLSDNMTDIQIKAMMLRIADDDESIARRLEILSPNTTPNVTEVIQAVLQTKAEIEEALQVVLEKKTEIEKVLQSVSNTIEGEQGNTGAQGPSKVPHPLL